MDMPVAEGDPWTCIISDAGTTFSPTFTSRMGGTHGAEWTCTPGNATVTKYGSTDHFVSLAAAMLADTSDVFRGDNSDGVAITTGEIGRAHV